MADLENKWLLKALTKVVDGARARGVSLPELEEIGGLVDQYRGQAPHEAVGKIPFPLVLYFVTEEDRAEFMAVMKEAKPNMQSIPVERQP